MRGCAGGHDSAGTSAAKRDDGQARGEQQDQKPNRSIGRRLRLEASLKPCSAQARRGWLLCRLFSSLYEDVFKIRDFGLLAFGAQTIDKLASPPEPLLEIRCPMKPHSPPET
jgi:hypothetical protein